MGFGQSLGLLLSLAAAMALGGYLLMDAFVWWFETHKLPKIKAQLEKECPWACGECSWVRWQAQRGITITVPPHRCKEALDKLMGSDEEVDESEVRH